MHVRCSYCSHTFNLSREYLAEAIARSEKKGHKYHALECINCRKQIKVPVEQMRQNLPAEPEEANGQE